MKRKQTYTAGANTERSCIVRFVRNRLRRAKAYCNTVLIDELESMLSWLATRDERYNKRKGGLGK